MDKSIENIAADDLSIPKKRAPVIVTPALLAPGIKANTWNTPIINAWKLFILSHEDIFILKWSAIKSKAAKTTLVTATTLISLKYNCT